MSATVQDASPATDDGQPSKLFSAREIGEFVLQLVGAYTPMEGAADADELARTIGWMELIIADLAGRKRLQFLIPATLEIALEDDVASYVLSDIAGSAFPSRRIAYPISAWKRIGTDGGDTPVDIIRRENFEDIITKTTSGPVDKIYIDRNVDDPVLYTYPVKAADTTDITLRMTFATYARSVFADTTNPDHTGDVKHGFEAAWQLWLINATAAVVGNGPVRQCTKQKLDGIKEDADKGLIELLTFSNRENQSMRLRRTQRYGG